MICRESSFDEIKSVVKKCLNELYSRDAILFGRSGERILHENCLVFRFGHYLQNELDCVFYVDHEFNSSVEYKIDEQGNYEYRERDGKKFVDSEGNESNCLVDLIVHERKFDVAQESDFLCFEFKKWNNNDRVAFEKDQAKLKYLTSQYNYRYGFHLVFGDTEENTQWTVFANGDELKDVPPLYE